MTTTFLQGDAFELTERWMKRVRPLHAEAALGGKVFSNHRFDALITDFPYAEKTHAGARTGSATKKLISFKAITEERLRGYLELVAPLVRAWAIFTADRVHVAALEASPPVGWRFVQYGVWVKPGAAPQFSGDRPAAGWEAVAVMHKTGGRMKWNGGGHDAVWKVPVQRGMHETQKPLALVQAWIRDFTKEGDRILDPFAGSATTLFAARGMGRHSTGIELDPERWAVGKQRLDVNGMTQGDLL